MSAGLAAAAQSITPARVLALLPCFEASAESVVACDDVVSIYQRKEIEHDLQALDPAVLSRVGEVMGLADGCVRVRWASGAVELIAPQVWRH